MSVTVAILPRDPRVLAPDVPFKVASIAEGKCNLTAYNRRDFYKVTLITQGHTRLLYASREYNIHEPALIFTCPTVPFSWDPLPESPEPSGWFCVYTDSFLQLPGSRTPLSESPLYKAGGSPVFMLDAANLGYVTALFTRMRAEIDSDYRHKMDVVGKQLGLLLHEALRMQPAAAVAVTPNAPARLTRLFADLLEKQFPVDFPDHPLNLKKPADFAALLHVHANHLNAAVQEVTGKSTSSHINERILREACSLIRHTDLTIAEIAFSLGFEYVSYFNRFFKKHTGSTPLAFRNEPLEKYQ
jgi:AraC-like DNA-binding protein